jgi:hypothetical protein
MQQGGPLGPQRLLFALTVFKLPVTAANGVRNCCEPLSASWSWRFQRSSTCQWTPYASWFRTPAPRA